jgi:two-component system NtrC family sensor kinase
VTHESHRSSGSELLYNTRAKLTISLLGVTLLVGVVSLFMGGRLLYRAVLNEATTRISQDLNAAREIYSARGEQVHTALTIAALDAGLQVPLEPRNRTRVAMRLSQMARRAQLDFAGLVLPDGTVYCRAGPNTEPGEQPVENPIARHVLRRGTDVWGTVVLDQEFLEAENPELARQARIELIPTPRAAPREETVSTQGMTISSGVPLFRDGGLQRMLYGGVLLNRDRSIVDTVRETVFRNETFKGRSIGTATIFLEDLRISTNVLTEKGARAIGTRVSREVRDRVLLKGDRWTDRAFVVSDWYMTAYEPIVDIFGERMGILYVGVLEEKYIDVRRRLLTVFVLITAAGMAVAVGLGYLLTDKLIHPVRRLIQASQEVAEGNLEPDIGPISRNEIGVLQKTFSQMLTALRERDRRQRAESESMLLQTEKQAGIGRLAAGVAHEINNPLTGVLTFTHMLLRRRDLDEQVRADLQTIAQETERVRRIVKGLLDFSRQTRLDREPVDVNRLVRATAGLVENQALVNGINLQLRLTEEIPEITLDRNQIQSVIMNMIINAFDATPPGGTVTVSTGISVAAGNTEQKGVEVVIADTGCGIPQENLGKLFDPFFTTKEVGQGTGLGLSVSYGIVERHGGVIRVQSEVGKGSTFTVWLPLDEKPTEENSAG